MPDFVEGNNSGIERMTALYYEGIVKQNSRNLRASGLEAHKLKAKGYGKLEYTGRNLSNHIYCRAVWS